MCSAERTDDRTTAARIRDAAILRFGEVGFGKATVRDIAADAGVSPGLVLHHFGSKAGLREACDEHVVAEFGRSRIEAVESGTTDPFAAMAGVQGEQHLMRYFLQGLRDNSPGAGRLFRSLFEETLRLMELSVEQGVIRPSENLHDLTAVLLGWQFGGLLLQEQVAQVFGTGTDAAEMMPRYACASIEALTHGVFADTRYEDAWREYAASGEPPPVQDDPA
ncbi:TetR/AcrR family transcriptional regulator [Anaerosoma tenue]|uniref:TetR/AcrR family transcriptional regulator n=1 Tax=Anaerosoma tenue TaxID=2933588 RepID=UPI00226102CA|nr:TetR/AcrR family transcriptional regulator [Anaerosoma tenue]MCK8115371.1 TetR/AcrR family transcriptional regulator [Anaerosoma tenue]